MIPKPDTSMRPGWTIPWVDGSGWTGIDALAARQNGWYLDIQSFGIDVREDKAHRDGDVLKAVQQATQRGYQIPFYMNAKDRKVSDKAAFHHLLERAMTGDSLSVKALYLMVYNDPEVYGEFAKTVEALKETYGTSES